MKTINVQYPNIVAKIFKTEAQAKAMGYKAAIVRYEPVNRINHITVKKVARLVQEEFMTAKDFDDELEDMSVAQTGMGRTEFQNRFGKAWNE